MHRAAYDRLGLDWRYDAYDVSEAGLPGFVDGLDESWRGLSLTMPLKRAVLPLLDDVSAIAREVGAANTVILDAGGPVGLYTNAFVLLLPYALFRWGSGRAMGLDEFTGDNAPP